MKITNHYKRALLFIFATILFTTTNLKYSAAQGADQVKQMFLQQMNLEVNAISNPAFDGVFIPSLYEAKFTLFEDDNVHSRTFDYTVFATNSSITRIYTPSTSKTLPYLNKMIDPDFRLNKNTAPGFKKALEGLLGEDFFDDGEVDGETIRRDNNEWHFLTGEFFDDYKGFVITVADDGSVEKVAYNLKLIPIEE